MQRRPQRVHRPVVLALLLLFGVSMSAAATADRGKKARKGATGESSYAEQLEFGVQMAKRGLWSEALFRFKQAGRLSPQNPRILNNMAVAYEALGQFDRALDYYQQAIQAAPGNKELKANYSRFVEFYRSFKPAEDEEDEDGEGG